MAKIKDLDIGEILDIKDVMSSFIESVERYGEKDEDGDIAILVGDGNYNHDIVWINPQELEAVKKFIESTWF